MSFAREYGDREPFLCGPVMRTPKHCSSALTSKLGAAKFDKSNWNSGRMASIGAR